MTLRWKGFFFLFILLDVVLVISILSIDRWMESGLEKAGQAIIGAKVEIDRLDFNLLKLSIQWDRLQITDPNNTMENVLETGRAAFRMSPPPLFRKRVIIDKMTLADVRSGTPRSHDGKLPKKRSVRGQGAPTLLDKMNQKLTEEIEQLPIIHFDPNALKDKINVDSLIVLADLQIVHHADSVQDDIIRTTGKWETFYTAFHPEEDLRKIREDFIHIDIKKIKTLPELLLFQEKVQSAHRTFSALSDTINNKYREVHQDIHRLASYRENMGLWIDEDYQKILQKARLPDINAKNIGKVLFGKALMSQTNKVLKTIDMIRKLIPEKKEKIKKQKKPRMKGQTIHFPDRHHWPALLVKKIHLSGQTGDTDGHSGLVMRGEARGITSQPDVYGKPTIIELRGESFDRRSAAFRAVLDHTSEASSDSFQLMINHVPMNDISVFRRSDAQFGIKKADVDFKGVSWMGGEWLKIQLDVTARQIEYNFSQFQKDEPIMDIIRTVIGRMDVITLHAEIDHRGDDFDFRLNSNVDNRISRELNRVVGKTLSDTHNRIRSKLTHIRDEKLVELDHMLQDKQDIIQAPMDDYKKQVDEIRIGIDEKIETIKKDIEERKSKEGGKLRDLLKDVLKKKK